MSEQLTTTINMIEPKDIPVFKGSIRGVITNLQTTSNLDNIDGTPIKGTIQNAQKDDKGNIHVTIVFDKNIRYRRSTGGIPPRRSCVTKKAKLTTVDSIITKIN